MFREVHYNIRVATCRGSYYMHDDPVSEDSLLRALHSECKSVYCLLAACRYAEYLQQIHFAYTDCSYITILSLKACFDISQVCYLAIASTSPYCSRQCAAYHWPMHHMHVCPEHAAPLLANEAGVLQAKNIVAPGVSQVGCQVVQRGFPCCLCLQRGRVNISLCCDDSQTLLAVSLALS
jgi:hypothetical protein